MLAVRAPGANVVRPHRRPVVSRIERLRQGRSRACAYGSTGEQSAELRALFTVRDGKVLAVHGYFSDEDLLASVGVI